MHADIAEVYMIRTYQVTDQRAIMRLIESEGLDWKDYYHPEGRQKYLRSLLDSITIVKTDGDEIIGYVRAIDDHGFGIYVCDLLVHQNHRGHGYGHQMMNHLMDLFKDQTFYVMSDVDSYYEQLGYERIGSIFQLKR